MTTSLSPSSHPVWSQLSGGRHTQLKKEVIDQSLTGIYMYIDVCVFLNAARAQGEIPGGFNKNMSNVSANTGILKSMLEKNGTRIK